MTIDESMVNASWGAPAWAEECTTDEDAVIYSRVLGQMMDLNGDELPVELVQRDELSATADTVSITRRPADLRMARALIEAEAAGPLARMLMNVDGMLHHEPGHDEARPLRDSADRTTQMAS